MMCDGEKNEEYTTPCNYLSEFFHEWNSQENQSKNNDSENSIEIINDCMSSNFAGGT
jgi:hypothetical protein